MKTWLLTIALLLASSAHAQLAVYTFVGTTETRVDPTFDFGRVAQGDSKDVRLRLRYTPAVALSITNVTTGGGAFRVSDRPSLPFVIPAGGAADISVRFEAGAPAVYTSTLQFTTAQAGATSMGLTATSVPAAGLTVTSGCTLNAFTLNLGRVEVGQSPACRLSLRNSSGQQLSVGTLRVTGSGYQGTAVALPVTLAPAATFEFTVTFAPTTPGVFAGTLVVETRTYTLTTTVVEPPVPPIPKPSFEFDRALQSAQQIRLSLRLPSPSPATASGFVNLSITPDNPDIATDPAVLFLINGERTVPFTVRAGESQLLLSGQTTAAFQTGTTAGRLTFTLTGVSHTISGDPATVFTISPSPVGMDTVTGARRTGNLDVQVVGFDNTYSAGQMSFTFYDRAGRVVEGSPLRADFTSEFRAFFTRTIAGSTFRMLLSFPVRGDESTIGAVDVEMQNASGRSSKRVSFP